MIAEILIFVITSLVFFIVHKHYKLVSYFRSKGVKCKSGLPLFGNIYQSSFQKRHIVDDIDEIYRRFPEERYVGYIEATNPIYLIRDPELIKSITVKDFDHFMDHRGFNYDPIFENSLIFMKGDKWRDMRNTLSPAFTGSKIRAMIPFIFETSHNFIQYLKETEGQELDLGDLIRRFTNDVIASVAFGLQLNSFKDPNNDFFKAGQSLLTNTTLQKIKILIKIQFPIIDKILNLGPMIPQETTAFFREIVTKTMKYRETNNILRADMIQILMEAAKGTLKNTSTFIEDDSVGFATTKEHSLKTADKVRDWTEDELVAQAFLFFAAGFDSSASVLTIALHELAIQKELQEKLYQEIKKHEELHQTLAYGHIQDLKYLDCVISETLRKWTPAMVLDRVCLKPYELPSPHVGGKPVMLKPGDVVYNATHAIHMDKQYYSEPEKFIPERFIDTNKDKINPFTFLPFGSGPRNCIGSRFALLELKILIYYVILNFEIIKYEKTSDPIRLDPAGFNIRIKGGNWVKMKSRPQ